jgi:hypothetical protein
MNKETATQGNTRMLSRAAKAMQGGSAKGRFLVADLSAPSSVTLSQWTTEGRTPVLEKSVTVGFEAERDDASPRLEAGRLNAALDAAILEASAGLESPARDAIAILPEDFAQKKVLEIPLLGKRLRRRLLRARAVQFSGIADVDLIMDARTLVRGDAGPGGKEKVLVVAASRSECSRYIECLKRAGLRAVRLTTPQASALVVFEASRVAQGDAAPDSEVGLFVDECGCVICLFHSDHVSLVRTVRLDTVHDAAGLREQVLGEIDRSILFASQNDEKSIPRVVNVLDASRRALQLSSGGWTGGDVRDAAPISLVRTADGATTIACGDAARRLHLSIGAAIAQASRGRFELPDLLPLEKRPKRFPVAIQVATIGGLGLLALMLYRSHFELQRTLFWKRGIREQYEQELRAVDPVIDRFGEWRRKKEWLGALQKAVVAAQPKTYSWSNLLRDLTALPDGDVRLEAIRVGRHAEEHYDPNRGVVPADRWTVTMDGLAGTDIPSAQDLANQFAIAVRRSRYVARATLEPLTSTADSAAKTDAAPSGPKAIPFTIECDLE